MQMKKITLIAVLVIFSGMSIFTGCKKKNDATKAKTTVEHNHHDGHDHSSHNKDDGHGH